MATIKSYTDLNQSKVLSKILSDDSADMRYHTISQYNQYPCDEIVYTVEFGKASGKDIPCWSLAALLNVLPHIQEFYPIIAKINDRYVCRYANSGIFTNGNNPINACVAMIEKLNELNLL